MINYFYGEDTYGARQALAELAGQEQASLRFLDRFDLEQESLSSRLRHASRGLFGKDVLVVRDPSSLPAAVQATLVETASVASPLTVVLWDRVKPDKRSAFFKAFGKNGRQFAAKSEPELVMWLKDEAKKISAEIDTPAAQELVRRVGADRWALLSELAKLSLQSAAISQAHVKESVEAPEQAELIFALTEAILRQDRPRAVKVLESLLAAGEKEIALLGFMASQIRMLLLIQQGVQENLAVDEIAKKYSLHTYAVQKSLPAAKRWSRSRLLDMYTRILATDVAVKGKVDARTGLTMLVLAMTEQAGKPAMSSRPR